MMMMSTRRHARECVVQILFTLDLNKDKPANIFRDYWKEHAADDKFRVFVENHVNGVIANIPQIDALLKQYAENWDVARMGGIERNVMRMALYEMLFRDDIPPVVSINEAVDIAKYFSTRESGKFVNGILDRIRKSIDRPARTGRDGGNSESKPVADVVS
jgi:N utilization substance protein B